MTPYVLILGFAVYGLGLIIWPRVFGRMFSAVSKLDPITWGIDPRQREIRDGFVRAAGAVMLGVGLYLFTLL